MAHKSTGICKHAAEIRRAYKGGAQGKELVQRYGFAQSTIYAVTSGRICKDCDEPPIRKYSRYQWPNSKFKGLAKGIRERHSSGEYVADLASEYGVPFVEMRQLLRGDTYYLEGGPIATTLNYKPPALSDDDVIAIRQAIAAGAPSSNLAKQFDVPRHMISNACSGKTHRHLNTIAPPVTGNYKRADAYKKIAQSERQRIYDYYQTHERGERGYISMGKMADYHGVDLSLIYRISTGERL